MTYADVFGDPDGSPMSLDDFRSLAGNNLLTDNTLRAAFHAFAPHPDANNPCTLLDPGFLNYFEGQVSPHDYELANSAPPARNGRQEDFVLMPYLIYNGSPLNGHWVLVAVKHGINVWTVLDSLGSFFRGSLNSIGERVRALCGMWWPPLPNERPWTFEESTCTNQGGTMDCGIHTMENAFTIMRGENPGTTYVNGRDTRAEWLDTFNALAASLLVAPGAGNINTTPTNGLTQLNDYLKSLSRFQTTGQTVSSPVIPKPVAPIAGNTNTTLIPAAAKPWNYLGTLPTWNSRITQAQSVKQPFTPNPRNTNTTSTNRATPLSYIRSRPTWNSGVAQAPTWCNPVNPIARNTNTLPSWNSGVAQAPTWCNPVNPIARNTNTLTTWNSGVAQAPTWYNPVNPSAGNVNTPSTWNSGVAQAQTSSNPVNPSAGNINTTSVNGAKPIDYLGSLPTWNSRAAQAQTLSSSAIPNTGNANTILVAEASKLHEYLANLSLYTGNNQQAQTAASPAQTKPFWPPLQYGSNSPPHPSNSLPLQQSNTPQNVCSNSNGCLLCPVNPDPNSTLPAADNMGVYAARYYLR